jgi:hypothetical protein
MLKINNFLILICSLAIFIYVLGFFPYPSNFEDSYITYRYVDAISNQGGFYYNYDRDAIYGMTGLVFPIISAIANLLIKNAIISTTIVGLLISFISVAMVVRYIPKNKLSYLLMASFLTNTIFLRGATNGLETPLVFLYIINLYLMPRKFFGFFSASLYVVLGFYIRPDIALISFLFFMVYNYRDSGIYRALSFSFYFFVLITGFLIASNFYFGTALPLPAYLKISGLALFDYPRWVFSQYLFYPIIFCSSTIIVAISILISSPKSYWEDILFLILPLFFYTIYQLTTLPIMNIGYRFFAPQIAGILAISIFILRKQPALVGKYFIPIAIISLASSLASVYFQSRESFYYVNDHKEFARLGESLSKVPDIYIASSEAGKLGFYSIPSKFFDTIGLNNSFVAKNYSRSDYSEKLYNFFVQSRFPDIYVRPSNGIGASGYAYLENMKKFSQLYYCNNINELKICVLNKTNLHKEISIVLAEFSEKI